MRKRTRGLDERFIEVCRLLNEHGVDYVVGGGVATTLHGHVRATKDMNDQIVTVIGDDPRYLSLRALKKAKDTDRLTDAADLQALDALGKRTAPCAGPAE